MDMRSEQAFDLVMGDLDGDGCFVAALVILEGLSRQQAVLALAGERSSQLHVKGRDFDVTRCHGGSFELLNQAGRSYRRYFLERTA